MSDLNLPDEIIIPGLYPDCHWSDFVAQLSRVLDVQRDRMNQLAADNARRWAGPPTVLVIVPSSVVLADERTTYLVEKIVRFARVTGISVRLIDALEPVVAGTEIWPRAVYGNSNVIATFANDEDTDHVTFHRVKPSELCDLIEQHNAPGSAPPGTDTADQRAAVQRILLAAGRPYRVEDILKALGDTPAGLPLMTNTTGVVQSILDDLVANAWADCWIEHDGNNTYQVVESYQPGTDDETGIREVIRQIMLDPVAGDMHLTDIVAEVSARLRERAYFPDGLLIESHVKALATERFLGEPAPNTFTVTVAARRHYQDAFDRSPNVVRPLALPGSRLPEVLLATRLMVAEAILTVLRGTDRMAGREIADHVDGLLAEQDKAVSGSTIEHAIDDLVRARHIDVLPMSFTYVLTDRIRKELNLIDGLARYRQRTGFVRDDVLKTVRNFPGSTAVQIRESGSFCADNDNEVVAALRLLTDVGALVHTDGRYYDRIDADALKIGEEPR